MSCAFTVALVLAVALTGCLGAPPLRFSSLWSVHHSSGLTFPVIDDASIFVADSSGNVLALDKVSGLVLWSASTGFTGGMPAAHPTVYGDLLFVQAAFANGTAPGLLCLNKTTGAEVYRLAFEYAMNIHVTAFEGKIYYSTEPHLWNATMVCREARTGKLLWRKAYRACTRVNADSSIAPDVVYFGFNGGSMAVNASTGEQLWQYSTGLGNATNEPGLSPAAVFFADFHVMYAVCRQSGKLLWRVNLETEGETAADIANGATYVAFSASDARLFFETFAGPVFALNASTGQVLATAPKKNGTHTTAKLQAFAKDFLVVYDKRYLIVPSVQDNRLYALSTALGSGLAEVEAYRPAAGWGPTPAEDHWPNEIVIDARARAGFVVAGSSIWALRLF